MDSSEQNPNISLTPGESFLSPEFLNLDDKWKFITFYLLLCMYDDLDTNSSMMQFYK